MTKPPAPTDPNSCDASRVLAAVAAAYQVTARLLSSEQQVIWNRTQSTFALNLAAVALIWRIDGPLQPCLAALGLVLSFLSLASFYRSWGFRDSFASILCAQEVALGLPSNLAPLTWNRDNQTLQRRGAPQPWVSYTVGILFIVIYGAIFLFAVLGVGLKLKP